MRVVRFKIENEFVRPLGKVSECKLVSKRFRLQ